MEKPVRERLRRTVDYILYFLKWAALAGGLGATCGAVGTAFHYVVEEAGDLFGGHGWLLYLLPVAGLAIVGLYHLTGQDRGTDMVLASLRTGEPIPPLAAVRMFVATALTHLCGGSAGREGAALVIGAGISSCVTRVFRLKESDGKLLTMCGMAGLFSAVFGTPVTAALFSLEVSAVGVMRYAGLFPSLTASLSAWGVSSLLGTHGVGLPTVVAPAGNWLSALKVTGLALLCALCSILFLAVIHLFSHLYHKYLKNPYIRAVVGGILVIIVTLLLGTRAYNGAGMASVIAAVEGKAVPWAFLVKILLTALTISAGFKGGEIVPSFFIGATLGCVLGPLLGLEPGFAAAIGLIALFCGVVNCPVASLVLSIELFGGGALGFFAIACAVSYLMSGYYSLYGEQQILSKLGGEEE